MTPRSGDGARRAVRGWARAYPASVRILTVIALVLAAVAAAIAGDSAIDLRLAAGPALTLAADDQPRQRTAAMGVLQLGLVEADGLVAGLERQLWRAPTAGDGRVLATVSDVYLGWGWGAPDAPWRFELAPLAGYGWIDERNESTHVRDNAIEVGARAAASWAVGARWRLGLEARAWRDQTVLTQERPTLIVRGGALLGTVSYRLF
jgi:hypothetical protein